MREPWLRSFRERVAFAIAPWVYVPHREEREEAFKMLAEVAYGSRDAVWTSPKVLVKSALEYARTRRVNDGTYLDLRPKRGGGSR